MSRLVRHTLVGCLAASMLVVPSAAPAGDATVSIEDDVFAPREVAVGVGELVSWSRGPTSTGPHNVRQDEGLFDSGPTTEGPIDYEVRLSAGTFHYFCEAHGSRVGGMDGVVRVAPEAEDGPAGRRFLVRWAAGDTATGTRFDVQYRRGRGKWREWEEGTRRDGGVFGKRGKPERPKEGARFRFRVRSIRGDAVSRWSPRTTFVV